MTPSTPPPHPTWGWTVPVRVLLATVGGLLALALLARSGGRGEAEAVPAPTLVVDPNEAPAPVLMALPAIGPVLAGRIVEGRADGPYRSLDDLDRRIRGIGPATTAALRPHLLFDPPAPAR